MEFKIRAEHAQKSRMCRRILSDENSANEGFFVVIRKVI